MAGDPEDITIEDDQPIVVELEPEEDAGDDEALKLAQEKEPVVVTTQDDGTKALTEQLEAAKAAQLAAENMAATEAQRADEALRYAQEQHRQAWAADRARVQSDHDSVQAGLAGAQSELAAAQSAYEKAAELGDYKAQGEATARMSRASQLILQHEQNAAMLAQQQDEFARRQTQQQRQPQQRPQPRQLSPAELIEMTRQSTDLMPQEKDFLLANPNLITNQGLNDELKVASEGARRLGLIRGTPEFLEHVSHSMGIKQPAATTQATNGGSRVQAPVSRASGGSTSRPQTVKLTPNDLEFLDSVRLNTPEGRKNYARNKLNVPERIKELNRGQSS